MNSIIPLLVLTQTPRMKNKAPKIKTDKIDICLNELYCSNR